MRALLLLLFLQTNTIQGQDYFHERYSIRDGLNSNSVYEVLFDKHGRLLILTDHGLNIVSGSKITKVTGSNSNLSFLKAFYLNDSIVLCTYNSKIYTLHSDDQIKLNPINRIFKKSKKNSSNYLLHHEKDNYIMSNFFELNTIKDDSIVTLVQTTGTTGNNLFMGVYATQNRQKAFVVQSNTPPPEVPGFLLRSIRIKKEGIYMPGMGIKKGILDFRYCAKDSNLYISCNGLCAKYTDTGLNELFILKDETITSLNASHQYLWIGTDKGNIYQVKPKGGSLNKIATLKSVITSIAHDANHNVIWASSEGDGILKIDLLVHPIQVNPILNDSSNFYKHSYSYKSHYYYSVKNYALRYKNNSQVRNAELFRSSGNDRRSTNGFSISFYIKIKENQFIAGDATDGLLRGTYSERNHFFWYRTDIDTKVLTGIKLNDSTCLLGGLQGLYLFNIKTESKYDSGLSDESEELKRIEVKELGETRVTVLSRLKNGLIIVGTKGKGIYLFNPKTYQLEKVTALQNTSITEFVELSNGELVFGTFSKLYFCNLQAKKLFVKNIISLPEIKGLDYSSDKLIAFTSKGTFEIRKTPLHTANNYKLSTNQHTISMAWNSTMKSVEWTCNAIEINQEDDFFEIDLIQGSDTQTFYRSNSNFDFKGFSHGSYDCIIRINPKKGWASNDLALKVNLLPPWYLSATAKFSYFILGIFLMAFIIYVFTKYHKKKYHQQSENVKLELAAIRNVIKPHYLYNTLNTLQAVAYFKDFEKLNKYIAKLSQWLRLSLSDNDHQVISLERELKLITAYLELEKMKFEHGLTYLILNKVPKSQVFNVPFFILQPIIENVLKYSFMDIKLAKLTIDISYSQNTLVFDIMDNGHGNEIENKSSTKKGHSLIERKLALFDILNNSPKKSTYHINYYPGIGTKSTILIFY